MDEEEATGKLYGIGVGPGGPDLLTLRAERLIRQVPLLFVPRRTSSEQSYAYGIIADLVDTNRQEIVSLSYPMTKDPEQAGSARQAAAHLIAKRLREGQSGAFISEGDPFLYSTFIYAYCYLRTHYPAIPIEVVPGVTSMTAAAAVLGQPLVEGSDRLAILPATYEGPTAGSNRRAEGTRLPPREYLNNSQVLRQVLQEFDTIVLLKVHTVFDYVLDLLEDLHLVGCAALVRRASAADEEIIRDVRRLRGQKLDYLSLLIIRKLKD